MKKVIFPLVLCASVLVLCAPKAYSQVIVDNFGSANGFSTGILSPSTTGNYLAQSFTTDNATYNFVDVTVQVNVATTDALEAAIYDTVAQFPGNNLSGFVAATPAGTDTQTLQFNNLAASLTGLSKYWVVLRSTTDANSNFFWFHASNLNNLGNGQIGTGSVTHLHSATFGTTWVDDAPLFVGSESYILRVSGSSVTVATPEPGTLALILLGGGSLGLIRRRRS